MEQEALPIIYHAQVLYKDHAYVLSSSGYDKIYDGVLSLTGRGIIDRDEYKEIAENHRRIKAYLDHWEEGFNVIELTPNASQISYAGVTWKRTDGRLINEARLVTEYAERASHCNKN